MERTSRRYIGEDGRLDVPREAEVLAVFVVMLRLLRFATPQAPPSIEQRSATSLLTWWRFSSMVRPPVLFLEAVVEAAGRRVTAMAALVGSLAEAASAACDRVLRGLPASSTIGS